MQPTALFPELANIAPGPIFDAYGNAQDAATYYAQHGVAPV